MACYDTTSNRHKFSTLYPPVSKAMFSSLTIYGTGQRVCLNFKIFDLGCSFLSFDTMIYVFDQVVIL